MTRSTVWLFACCFATGLLLAGVVARPDGDRIEPVEPQASPAAVLSGDGGAILATPSPDSEPVAVPRPEPVRVEPTERTVIVRGRCVAHETDQPLSDCDVEIEGRRTYGEPGDVLATVTTDEQGYFEAAVNLFSDARVHVEATRVGRASVRGTLPRFPSNVETIEAGVLPLVRGTVLKGSVRSEDGRLLADVPLRLERDGTPTRRYHHESSVELLSDQSGHYMSAQPLPAGRWKFIAPDGYALLQPDSTLQLEGGPTRTVGVVLREPDPDNSISGRILSEAGEGIVGARVHARTEYGNLVSSARTDSTGSFHLQREPDFEGRVRLSVDASHGRDALEDGWLYDWGTRDVVLVAPDAASVRVRVRVAGTQTPVEDYRLSWFRLEDGRRTALEGVLGQAGYHEDGVMVVTDIPRGRIRLVVTPTSRKFAPSEPLELELAGGKRPELSIEVERRITLPVRVVDSDGAPVSGTRLELLATASPIEPETFAIEPFRHAQLTSTDGYAMLLDEAASDSSGEARLRWPATRERLAIRAKGSDHLLHIERDVFLRGERAPLTLVVHQGAGVTGRVEPASVLAALRRGQSQGESGPSVVLTRKSGGRAERIRRSATVQADGTFEILGLPPGTYSVLFRDVTFDAQWTSNPIVRHFDDVELRAGDAPVLTLDIRDCELGSCSGRVTLDGRAPRGEDFQLVRLEDRDQGMPQHAGRTTVEVDSLGRFEVETLPSGRYLAAVGELVFPGVVTVDPGRPTAFELELVTGALELEVTTPDGRPAARLPIVLQGKQTGARRGFETDERGRLAVPRVAPGEYFLRSGRVIGEVEVLAGSRATEALTLSGVAAVGEPR